MIHYYVQIVLYCSCQVLIPYLEQHHIKKIVDAYNAFIDIDGFAKVVDNAAISSNRALISIQSYVVNSDNTQQYDYDESIKEWLNQSVIMHSQVNQFLNISHLGS